MQFPPLEHLTPPITAIVGGMPGPGRLDLLTTLAPKVDYLVLGGALANLLMSGQADETLNAVTSSECELVLPSDVVVAKEAQEGVRSRNVPASQIPPNLTAFDLGTDSISNVSRCLEGSNTLLWHGPLGVVETPPFDSATQIVARHAAIRARAGRLKCHISGESLRAVLAQADLLETLSA